MSQLYIRITIIIFMNILSEYKINIMIYLLVKKLPKNFILLPNINVRWQKINLRRKVLLIYVILCLCHQNFKIEYLIYNTMFKNTKKYEWLLIQLTIKLTLLLFIIEFLFWKFSEYFYWCTSKWLIMTHRINEPSESWSLGHPSVFDIVLWCMILIRSFINKFIDIIGDLKGKCHSLFWV